MQCWKVNMDNYMGEARSGSGVPHGALSPSPPSPPLRAALPGRAPRPTAAGRAVAHWAGVGVPRGGARGRRAARSSGVEAEHLQHWRIR
jgi:hypothetical protein